MAKASPAQVSFNSGELSPMLDARTDYVKYSSGCSILENFLPSVQGPARRRGGTQFVAPARRAADRCFLYRFEYSADQAYVLEFSAFEIRFFTYDTNGNRIRLESPPGTPVFVATPWDFNDLFNTDGTCRLRFAQSADFLYITHPTHQTRILKRTSPTTFVLDPMATVWGPFKDINPDNVVTVSASAETGNITLTASSGIFVPDHAGSQFYLESRNTSTVQAWEPGKAVGIGGRRKSDAKVYEAVNAATTGAVRPIHTYGVEYDGDGGVHWQFMDPGYGYVTITGYVSPTVVNATVVSRLPRDTVGANSTTRWAHAAWSAVEGWPSNVTFFRERLWLTRNQTLWASVSAGFDDFSRLNYGEVTDDMAITVTLASGTINQIQWLIADKELIIGTAGNEFSLGEFSNGSPLAPGNVRVRQQSQFGSRSIVPAQAGNSILFIQRGGAKAREIIYDEINGYQSADVTIDSEHITRGENAAQSYTNLVDIDYAREPEPLVWCVRADGALIALTWNAEQRVRGWHRHPIGGGGRVDTVAVIPRPNGPDELWMVVYRIVNGLEQRNIEVMTSPYDPVSTPLARQTYMDAFRLRLGGPTATITGLTHLEGCTVDILADGAPRPQQVVTGGQITLTPPASTVVVGHPAPCRLRTMRMEAGAADGTAQTKTKRMHKMGFRFLLTGGGKFGPDDAHMEYFQFGPLTMDQPIPLFSGDKVVDWPKGYETEAYVQYTNDQPLAVTLEGIYPQIVTQDQR